MAQKLRVPIGFVIAAAVLYLAEPTRLSLMIGIPIAVLGVVCRALAAGVIKKDSSLATSGIYALTRNPLYLGSALLATGFAIVSANQLAAALLLLPFMLIYPTVMLREEAHLARLFPDEFRFYKSKTPRFVPRLSLRFRPSFSFERYLANREYNTAMGFTAATAVLLLKWWLI
jgi:protein-S-isoprenylcysteine O-methyltransferase Ste14